MKKTINLIDPRNRKLHCSGCDDICTILTSASNEKEIKVGCLFDKALAEWHEVEK